MDDETKEMFMDFGALGYGEKQMASVLGETVTKVRAMLKDGGSELVDQGRSRFEFQLDRRLMQLAAIGDMKALAEYEKRKRKRENARR